MKASSFLTLLCILEVAYANNFSSTLTLTPNASLPQQPSTQQTITSTTIFASSNSSGSPTTQGTVSFTPSKPTHSTANFSDQSDFSPTSSLHQTQTSFVRVNNNSTFSSQSTSAVTGSATKSGTAASTNDVQPSFTSVLQRCSVSTSYVCHTNPSISIVGQKNVNASRSLMKTASGDVNMTPSSVKSVDGECSEQLEIINTCIFTPVMMSSVAVKNPSKFCSNEGDFCRNGAKCVNDTDSKTAVCICADGYYGKQCEKMFVKPLYRKLTYAFGASTGFLILCLICVICCRRKNRKLNNLEYSKELEDFDVTANNRATVKSNKNVIRIESYDNPSMYGN